MIQISPVNANDQIIEADLDGTVYFIGLSWNDTGGFWTLSVRDGAGSVLISGLPMVSGWALTYLTRYSGIPKGEFVVTGEQPDRRAFIDGRSVLYYIPIAELTEVGLGKYYGGV